MAEHILSISYDESLLRMLEMLLRRQGYVVTSALGFSSAVELCKNAEFELIILGHSITKIDRMKTRQGDSLFLKADVNGETVRVFGRSEELAERPEASGYDIPASEIEAGMELHLPCLVKLGQGNSGYKIIEEFLPEAAA